MRLTNNHPSSLGQSVFMDHGNIIEYKDAIKQLRQKYNLNTTDFGKKLGVSSKAVESWEQGCRIPAASVLLLIKYVFK